MITIRVRKVLVIEQVIYQQIYGNTATNFEEKCTSERHVSNWLQCALLFVHK